MTRGAIATGCPHSAQAGADILAAGGNAIDALVGSELLTCFSLPTMTGLGGGGVATLRIDDELVTCDFFAAHPGLGFDGEKPDPDVIIVPFEGVRLPFRVGAASIAVPGAIAGLWAIHERFGSMPLSEVAEPAIEAGRRGIEVTEAQHRAMALLEPCFRLSPETWELIGRRDHVLQEGDHLRNPELADFLTELVADGPRLFYEGEIAQNMEDVTSGYISVRDLAEYEPRWSVPLTGQYRHHRVHTFGRPSFNGALLIRSLAELDREGPLPPYGTFEYWERIADALRAADMLRTPEYEDRMLEDGFLQGVAAGSSGCTMHCSIVDDDGNAVSVTTTVGEGSGHVLPGTGIVLNNFLGEEDIHPEHHDPLPGQRMMTGMAPSLVETEDGGVTVLGGAGSARIRSAIFQTLVNNLDGGLRLDTAVLAPRIHPDGDTIYIESHGRTPDEVEELMPLGDEAIMTYEVGFFFGGVQAAAWHPSTGFSAGAESERRGGDYRVV